jgi:hypothetical protein
MRHLLPSLAARVNPAQPTRWLLCLGFFALLGCEAPPVESPRVGADRDAHGCIPSAGYLWDSAQQKCARPWEK